jgi:hypothetical protein
MFSVATILIVKTRLGSSPNTMQLMLRRDSGGEAGRGRRCHGEKLTQATMMEAHQQAEVEVVQ